ncbi:MAG: DegV family protein, partial [Lachnospiraceae bacterium]|nr:DegV family protein [Lachnospiraceae bacterium]
MKEAFHIISDGSCDLPPELVQEKNVTVVPFYVSFDEEHYFKENVDIGIRDFYQQMVERKGVYPKSSMPSIKDYEEAFLPFAEAGIPVICICITTKFSGSMQSALNARDILREKYPQSEITVMDSTVDTVLQGQYVLEAVNLRDNGFSYQDTIARLEEIKSTGRIFFTVGNMEYLKHGGRIGKVAALAGSVLDIRPVITLKQGEIFPSGIDRGRKRTTKKALELLLEYLQESSLGIDCYSIVVGYG